MFKVGRWKHEKIKVPFSLQFQATQLPCSKSKLMISLIPMDVGQPTVRLKKAAVQNGTCTWENPVYEIVKFIREIKTGIIQDKFYQFIISTGSSKKGFFGEVLVNFADFLDATTPTLIYQPINSSDAGAILHITIQNMQGADDQREFQRDIDENGGSISNEGSLQDQDLYYNATDGVDDEDWSNRRNGNKKKPESKDPSPADQNQRMRKPLTLDWSSEDDLVNYVEDTDKSSLTEQEREQEPPKSLVEQLKNEVFNLKRQAEVTDIELQSLRRQVTKESTRAQELSEQVVRLKEEREAFRRESEKYRSELNEEKGIEHPKEMVTESKKSWHHQNEDAVDLVHAKELNRALRSQLRKTQDSRSELILVVRDLEEKLGKKEKELINLTTKVRNDKKPLEFQDEDSDSSEYELFGEKEVSSASIDSKEVNALEQQIRNLQGELEEHLKEKRRLHEQIKRISQDFVIAKTENDDLSSKFNQKQLELIKKERECTQNMRKVEELESQIARLENMIQKQADEYCESSNIIHDLEMRVKSLKRELEKQEAEFEDEIKAIINVNVELEQRAIQAEENLQRTKLDNGSVDQKLREEFSELSKELETKFKENEELAAKSEAEARELKLHITILEERLEKATKELQLVEDQCETDMGKLLRKSKERENELEELLLAHKNESVELENMIRKVGDKCEPLSNENQTLRMEVERLTEENYNFTKMLQETNTLVDETKNLFQETKQDREELERKYTIARTEIDQAQEELKVLRSLKEKDYAMGEVQSELESLQVQLKELKTILSETRLENENLRKQLTRQKENLQKKDQELANLEKIKNSSSKEVSDLKEKVKQLKLSANSSKRLQNGSTRTTGNRRETLTEKGVDSQTSDLLGDVALLKEQNKTMEDELREMQVKYSDMSLKFAEVEGERQQLVMTIRNLKNRQKR